MGYLELGANWFPSRADVDSRTEHSPMATK